MPDHEGVNETVLIPEQSNRTDLNFVCGVISVLGQFNWYNNHGIQMPIFQIRMNVEELPLLNLIQSATGLTETPRVYKLHNRKFAQLVVRRLSSIQKLIDALEQCLIGPKALVFSAWRDKYYQKMLKPLYSNVSRETS